MIVWIRAQSVRDNSCAGSGRSHGENAKVQSRVEKRTCTDTRVGPDRDRLGPQWKSVFRVSNDVPEVCKQLLGVNKNRDSQTHMQNTNPILCSKRMRIVRLMVTGDGDQGSDLMTGSRTDYRTGLCLATMPSLAAHGANQGYYCLLWGGAVGVARRKQHITDDTRQVSVRDLGRSGKR